VLLIETDGDKRIEVPIKINLVISGPPFLCKYIIHPVWSSADRFLDTVMTRLYLKAV